MKTTRALALVAATFLLLAPVANAEEKDLFIRPTLHSWAAFTRLIPQARSPVVPFSSWEDSW